MQDVSKLTGLWYSPYLKIYSTGGDERIAEISTYPRAYRKTITEEYIDEETKEKVTGSYEIWEASESLPFSPKASTTHALPFLKEAVQGELVDVNILETQLSKDGGKSWLSADKDITSGLSNKSATSLNMTKAKDDPDKMIILIRYHRRFK